MEINGFAAVIGVWIYASTGYGNHERIERAFAVARIRSIRISFQGYTNKLRISSIQEFIFCTFVGDYFDIAWFEFEWNRFDELSVHILHRSKYHMGLTPMKKEPPVDLKVRRSRPVVPIIKFFPGEFRSHSVSPYYDNKFSSWTFYGDKIYQKSALKSIIRNIIFLLHSVSGTKSSGFNGKSGCVFLRVGAFFFEWVRFSSSSGCVFFRAMGAFFFETIYKNE